MSSRAYCNPGAPFLYTGGEPSSGMDCLQLRQSAGPFHYLISEQAKSLVALQELQHEVGALLEFRDLVIETFPNLRTKMANSSPATMTSHHHHHHHQSSSPSSSNIPIAMMRREWEPGVRVRRKLIHHKDDRGGGGGGGGGGASSSGSHPKKSGEIGVQDSGFSTETSSKETHSASSSTALCGGASSTANAETEDELWNLLDVIHRKGTRLKDELEALQDSIRESSDKNASRRRGDSEVEEDDFQRVLLHASVDDVRHLRRERDLLLDRVAEMEAELLAGRVHTSRLQEDLENLIVAKQNLEEQLKCAMAQSGEVNTRIHDLHAQFVTNKSGGVGGGTTPGSPESAKVPLLQHHHVSANNNKQCVQRTRRKLVARRSVLDDVMSECLLTTPKVEAPDSTKIAAILKEHDPLVLKKHLLNSTVHNQVLQEKLTNASSLEDLLDKAREENEELRFQLEDRNIELEGTRARVRMLEQLQRPPGNGGGVVSAATSSPDIIPNVDSAPPSAQSHERNRAEITTSSMKAMSPLPLNMQFDHSSSTESAHDQAESARKKRPPSKIPLVKSYAAPKPPGGGKHQQQQVQPSPAPSARSRSGESPGRPHSAQSVGRNRSEGGGNNNNHSSLLSGSKSTGGGASLPKSRNVSLSNTKDSLTGKLRSTESLGGKLRDSSGVGGGNNNSTSYTTSAARAAAAKKDLSLRRSSGGPVRRSNSIRDATDVKGDTNSATEKSQSLWVPSSLNSDSVEQYMDSLDLQQQDFAQPPTIETSSSYRYQTANTFLWNTPDNKVDYYDSIDTNFSSSLYHENGENLAECDSLEKHQLSPVSSSDIKL